MEKMLSITTGSAAPASFEDFIRPHFDRLYGRARALTGNTADAEDLMQDLCIRIYSHRDEVEKLENPHAWMRRVLYRLFVDLVRSRDRSPIRLMASNEAYQLLAESTATSQPGPEHLAEAAMFERRLQAAWECLSADDQVVLSLHGIEGLSLAEVQEITGLPIGTIKSRLHRSRVRLGRLLESLMKQSTGTARGIENEMPRRRESAG